MRLLLPGLLVLAVSPIWSADDPAQRAQAALAVPGNDPFADQELARVVQDATPAQRVDIIARIGAGDGRRGGDILAGGFADGDVRVAVASAHAFARLDDTDPGRLALLRAALDDPRAPVRSAAIAAVGALRDDRALPALIDLLDTPVGADAHRALENLAPQLDLPAERAAWRAWYDQQRELVGPQLDRLRELSETSDPAVVLSAVHELLFLRVAPSEVAGILEPLATHPDAGIATLARAALGTSPSPVARRALARLAAESDGTQQPVEAVAVIHADSQTATASAASTDDRSTPWWPLVVMVVAVGAGLAGWRTLRNRVVTPPPPSAPVKKSRLKITFSS